MSYPGTKPAVSNRTTTSFSQPSIPLTPELDVDPQGSIGALVKDATTHVSTLVRAEIELAKLEIMASAKQGIVGAVFFILAGVIGLFSLFFMFFFFADLLDIWLPRWSASLITWGVMLVMVGGLVFLGIKKVKKIGKPERTIASLQTTATTLKAAATHPAPDTKA
ncbi:phage holin family protein [Nakamurella antarctica]|uniref:Phage holin family protein n=1 Tax=Nakamurella antarctica TaxID=1902245 RepID=A0A3G8ZTM4_9ACTN|nr:phage holin family protein [Nakamurella antarctica]AZI57151.1 phage holin family protein [Nakamurella antarctica]